jgi:hypothetical protein
MPVENKERAANERWNGEWKYCPLRDETSPEYRLLLATIREEIEKAITTLNNDHRGLLYSRLNLILMSCAVIAAVIKWH